MTFTQGVAFTASFDKKYACKTTLAQLVFDKHLGYFL